MPAVTFLLTIEASAVAVFPDLSSLSKADKEPIIIPGLQDISIIDEGGKDGISFWCLLCRLGIQLSGTNRVPVISFIGWWLSVVVFCQL